MRRYYEIVVLNREIADGSVRQVQLQGLPMVAIVEGYVYSGFRARKEKPFANRVFADGVGKASLGDATRNLLPSCAAISGAVEVRLVILEPVPVNGGVNRSRVVAGGHEHADLAPGRQAWWSDVVPGFAIVASDLDQAVVRPHPNFALLEWRR